MDTALCGFILFVVGGMIVGTGALLHGMEIKPFYYKSCLAIGATCIFVPVAKLLFLFILA